MVFKSVNPATEEVKETFKEEGYRTIEGKIEEAQKAFRDWKKLAIPVKSKHLNDVAVVLEENKEEYATLITEEMGKLKSEAIAEIEKCAWVCNYYAENGKLLLKEEQVKTEAEQSYVNFEPLGIVLAIMPWNFPFWQVFRFAAPALLAGNVALLKHAPNVPRCARALEDIFLKAGLPRHIFQNLFVSESKVKKVIEHEYVRAITLTGSEKAGSNVAQQAGKYIKKTVLELGGSDPFIVLREANLKEAAKVAVKARMLNSGQSCIAAKRIIVEASVYDSFLKLLKAEFEKVKCGDPMSGKSVIGPLAKEEFVKKLQDQVKQSIRKGAKIEIGATKKKRKGYFYHATLVTGVKPGMPLFDDEVFGPVMPVIKAESDDDAIALANNSRYGLGAALWTENMDQATRFVKQLQAGYVAVNDMVKSDPRLPFGGIKNSGYGRELSHYGLKEFVNIKTVVINK